MYVLNKRDTVGFHLSLLLYMHFFDFVKVCSLVGWYFYYVYEVHALRKPYFLKDNNLSM